MPYMLGCRLQDQDERNFLAWAYRRFIVRLAGVPPEDEAQYATDLINTNFSNYSAWHARTTLLHAVHGKQPVVSLDQLVSQDASAAAASGDSGAAARHHSSRQTDLHAMQAPALQLAIASTLLFARTQLHAPGQCCCGG